MSEKSIKDLEDLATFLLEQTDKIALLKLDPGSPSYNFQQILMKSAHQYRLFLSNKEKNNEQRS